jgi:hypothetical protein
MRTENEAAGEAGDAPLVAKPVWQITLMRLLCFGPNAWKTVNLATVTNAVPVHVLTGKPSNFAMGVTTTTSLHAFFEGLKGKTTTHRFKTTTNRVKFLPY